MDEDSPNTLISCNLCGIEITKCCMLSPDFSLKPQFEGAMVTMRKHFKDEHGIKKPIEGKWTIFINAKKYDWRYETISYEELNEFYKGFTILYSRGPTSNPQGTLTPGGYVKVIEGMVFDVTMTNNS